MRLHPLPAALAFAALTLVSCKTVNSQDPGNAASLKDSGEAPLAPAVEWLDGQEVTLDIGNKASFDEKLRVIDAATSSIRLGAFVFAFDDTGAVVAERLLKKAAEGVEVKIIVDALASLKWRPWWQMLVAASTEAATAGRGKAIQVLYFRPIADEVWQDLASWGFQDRKLLEQVAADRDAEKIAALIKANTVLNDKPAMRLFLGTLLPTRSGRGDLLGPLRDASEGNFPADTAFDVFVDGLFRGAMAGGFTFRGRAWINLSKRFQHRLLLVDDRYVVGGGRGISDHHNMEVDFSLKEESDDLLSYMGADFTVDSPALAAQAKVTFDDYWTCESNMQGCKAKIPMQRELAKADPVLRQKLMEQAKRFTDAIPAYQPTAKVLHTGRFSGQGVRVAYLESRMFPQRKGFEKLAFGEEIPAYHRMWEHLIAAAKPGEEVVLHNAYVLLPPGMQLALMRALGNGAKVRIYTNSPVSDHAELDVVMSSQWAALFTLAEKLRKEKNLPEMPLKIFTYQTRETLHAKVTMVGDTMIVGAAAADPRGKVLDALNGIVIAPGAGGNPIAASYRAWLADFQTRQRSGKPVMKELGLQEALEVVPPYAKVKATPGDYRTDQQFDAHAEHLLEMAMDPATDRPKALIVGGLLNTLFLNL